MPILSEGIHDPHIFKAVFMAGSPGAGKTTVAHQLFRGSGLKELNLDKFWYFYNKKQPHNDYDYYHRQYKKQENLFLDGKLGLLIDGTARDATRIKETKTRLESLGYETAMVFVNVSLETSLKRAEARATTPGPDFGRVVDPEFIEDAWKKTQHGITELEHLFTPNFYLIQNEGGANNVQRAARKINNWLNTPSRNPVAKEWIRSQVETNPKRLERI